MQIYEEMKPINGVSLRSCVNMRLTIVSSAAYGLRNPVYVQISAVNLH